MNREEKVSKLGELRSQANEFVNAYNNAIQEERLDEARRAEAGITQTVNEYTSFARDVCFEDCVAADDPMLAAVKALTFATIGIKDEGNKDEMPVRVIIEKEKPIDLLALDKYAHGIGVSKNWMHIAQKMNFLLTAQKAVSLGIDPTSINDSYAMTDIATGFDMGKNPVSKTNLLKSLQTVVSAMIGDDYKATSHDVNFLMSVFSKKSRKALSVTCANHRFFRNYMAEICHRIVTGKSYEVEFRAKK